MERFEQEAVRSDAELLLCTHKDLVKVGVAELGGRPLRAVAIEAELTVGGDALEARLAEIARAVALNEGTG